MLEDKKSPQLFTGTHPLSDSFRREMETLVSRFLGEDHLSYQWKRLRNARVFRLLT